MLLFALPLFVDVPVVNQTINEYCTFLRLQSNRVQVLQIFDWL